MHACPLSDLRSYTFMIPCKIIQLNYLNILINFSQGADSPDKETLSLLPISQTSVQDLQVLVEKISRVRDKFEQVWENHQNCVLQSLQFSFFEREFLDVSNGCTYLLYSLNYSQILKIYFKKINVKSPDQVQI